MGEVVGGAHAAEKPEARDTHLAGEDGQTRHGQHVVYAHAPKKCAFASHVGTRNDVVLALPNL